MKTTVEELKHLINLSSEDEHLEFNEAKRQFDTTNLFKYCVALANKRGGRLICDVTDKRPRRGSSQILPFATGLPALERQHLTPVHQQLPEPLDRTQASTLDER